MYRPQLFIAVMAIFLNLSSTAMARSSGRLSTGLSLESRVIITPEAPAAAHIARAYENDNGVACFYTCPETFTDSTGIKFSNIVVPPVYNCQYVAHSADGSTTPTQCIYDRRAGTILPDQSNPACPTAVSPTCGTRPDGAWKRDLTRPGQEYRRRTLPRRQAQAQAEA